MIFRANLSKLTFHLSSSVEVNGVVPVGPVASNPEELSAPVHQQHQQPELAPRSHEDQKNIPNVPLKASKSLTVSNHNQVHHHHHHTVYQNNEKY